MNIVKTNLYKTVKQLTDITHNRVVFVGSFSDLLKGFDVSPKDLDIIIAREDLPRLNIFGNIESVKRNRIFRKCDRAYIRGEIPLDIFIYDDEEVLNNFVSVSYKDLSLKIMNIQREISYLKEIISNTENQQYRRKYSTRLEALEVSI